MDFGIGIWNIELKFKSMISFFNLPEQYDGVRTDYKAPAGTPAYEISAERSKLSNTEKGSSSKISADGGSSKNSSERKCSERSVEGSVPRFLQRGSSKVLPEGKCSKVPAEETCS